MPHATRVRDTASGTSRDLDTQQIVDLFGFVGLHDLQGALVDVYVGKKENRRGRKPPYPALAMLAVRASARITGSLASCLALLQRDPHLWSRCRDAYEEAGGDPLALVPPTRDQMQYFEKQFIANSENLARLKRLFRKVALGQARALGNLLPDVVPDWAHPDPRHRIYGDGCIIGKFSDARVITHPITGEKVVVDGGKTKNPATTRIQDHCSNTAADGKHETGANMVSVHTWTDAGRVVLATGYAEGAEQWAALELIDALAEEVGDGIHTVVWDRALTGWHTDYLMARLRIQLIGKAVARSAVTAHAIEMNDAALGRRVDRTAAEYGATAGRATSSLLRRDVLADMLRGYGESEFPVGTSIYPTSRNKFDFIRSDWIELPDAEHHTTAGSCCHPLVVDDGGLFLADIHPEDGYLVKTRFLPCESATPVRREDGRWGRLSRYTIPCPHGAFRYEHLWEPEGTRFHPDSQETDRAPRDKAGWFLRPLSRPDDILEWYNNGGYRGQDLGNQRFKGFFSRRNDAESFNEWYQRTLNHHGRAATLHKTSQELDFLLAGLVNNSNIWHFAGS